LLARWACSVFRSRCWLGAADPEGARGLLADLDRIVAGEESEGWFGDDDAFRSIGPALLESTCRATAEARAEALSILQQRSERAGDPRVLFALTHEMSEPVAEALNLDRQRRSLELSLSRVAAECPFWLSPKPVSQACRAIVSGLP